MRKLHEIMAHNPYGLIYISGPMTGKKDFNRQAFADCKSELESLYHFAYVISPPELDGETEGQLSYIECLRRDVKYVVDAVALVAMEGWQHSRGAALETSLAATLEIPVFRYPSMRRLKVEPYSTAADYPGLRYA